MGSGSLSGRIGVVGTGVIGASWAAYFLAKGFDVAASDPADGAEKRLRTLVDGFSAALERVGLAGGASIDRLRFDPDIMRAIEGCAFVQRCSVRPLIYICPAALRHRPRAGAFGTVDRKLVARLRQRDPQRRAQRSNCAAVTERLGGADLARLNSQRDELLLALLRLKASEE
jgi:glycine/D-amino acid oxidase-like deaminating enzyme